MSYGVKELQKYVNAVADLAQSLEADIRNGQKISSKTVLNLSNLISAASVVEYMVEALNHDNETLN